MEVIAAAEITIAEITQNNWFSHHASYHREENSDNQLRVTAGGKEQGSQSK